MNLVLSALSVSGHYAIAGFLYQLIGSGVELLEVIRAPDVDDSEKECLVLECSGQDALIAGRNPR